MDEPYDRETSGGYVTNRAARAFIRALDRRLLTGSAGQMPVFLGLPAYLRGTTVQLMIPFGTGQRFQKTMVDSNVARIRPADEKSFRLAPHNIAAEQALLGAILVNNEAFYRVSDFLLPEHFYEPVHREIYEICGKIIRAGKAATPITVKTYLPDQLVAEITVPLFLARLAAEATP